MRSWESARGPGFNGRADSHHSLRHDRNLAEKCEEMVYAPSRLGADDRSRRGTGALGHSPDPNRTRLGSTQQSRSDPAPALQGDARIKPDMREKGCFRLRPMARVICA